MYARYAVVALAGMLRLAAAASPPACLLSAIGAEAEPSNVEALCTDKQADMIDAIVENCEGDAVEGAYDAFKATCAAISVEVDDLPTSTNSTGSATTASRTGTSTATSSNDNTSDDNDDNNNNDDGSAAAGLYPSVFLGLSGLIGAALFL